MHVARTLEDLRVSCTRLRGRGRGLALVPTMGALHAGHLSLIEHALATGAACIASIFVNPLQFGPNEDLASYPRDEERDLAVLKSAGCDLVWMPEVLAMYPPGDSTVIEVAGPAQRWEGTVRPGHFRGVATVCAKLFGQVGADLAFFGEKDWQQLQVVRRMVSDLHLPVRIVAVPTVREPDGLALSSRNRFLTDSERQTAPILFDTLRALAVRLAEGGPASDLLDRGRQELESAGMLPDYLALVHATTLEPINTAQPPARLITAARLGSVRLLDNIAVD
ncbi:MAG: pantoate--beta-alanine ligase [Acetobacteraceae bacterium]|nr:pantoate--beta-alanine ligase [Acetobacteraceae bacterium]